MQRNNSFDFINNTLYVGKLLRVFPRFWWWPKSKFYNNEHFIICMQRRRFKDLARGLWITNGLKEWLKLIHLVRCLLELYTKPTACQLFTGYRGIIIATHCVVIRAIDKPYFTLPPPLAPVALWWCWCTLMSPLLCDGILQLILFPWLVLLPFSSVVPYLQLVIR